jgi:hypothetical protein
MLLVEGRWMGRGVGATRSTVSSDGMGARLAWGCVGFV